MQCPNISNDMAFMAEDCPKCGQPGFGSVLNQRHLTPKQQADAAFGMIVLIVVMLGLAVIVGVGYLVLGAASYWSTWAVESPFVQNVVQSGIIFIKRVAITAVLFSPFAIISGIVTQSTQGEFLDGYVWGQFTGPIGLIVVIFQIPDKPRARDRVPQPAAVDGSTVARRKQAQPKVLHEPRSVYLPELSEAV